MIKSVMQIVLISKKLVFVLLIISAGCSVPLYKIASVPQNTPIEAARTANSTELEISAAALLDDDKAFERFEANLPLAGIAVIDVRLVNRADKQLKPKFELRDASGKKFARLKPKKETGRVMKFEGVRVYNKEGRRETLAQLENIALPENFVLAAKAEKRGVLFFNTKQDVTQIKGLILTVSGISQPIKISLN